MILHNRWMDANPKTTSAPLRLAHSLPHLQLLLRFMRPKVIDMAA
jgi:hypothetical protein